VRTDGVICRKCEGADHAKALLHGLIAGGWDRETRSQAEERIRQLLFPDNTLRASAG
jgi:hypothetical protein